MADRRGRSRVFEAWLAGKAAPAPRREDHPQRVARLARGWRLIDLSAATAATEAGRVDHRRLCHYEQGRHVPHRGGRAVRALAAAFGLPVDDVDAWFTRKKRSPRRPPTTTTLHPHAWARIEKRLSQEGLGRRLGVSQQSVACWEAGLARPTARRRKSIARILGQPPAVVDSWFNVPEPHQEVSP
ncbi:MAG TPA: helix-turn-helix transcriptional regulator [Thermoanaerobaculia bacterium]|nr:helix-turn-helix transcriptional regulator [Thermoanaerobaculia bacterium]